LEQGRSKRNIALDGPIPLGPARAGHWICDILDLNPILFDRNGQSPDQPREFVQIVGILLPDRLREPSEALVVAHQGDVTGNDRRRSPHEIGLDVWHLVTSLSESGVSKPQGGMSRFSDQFTAWTGRWAALADAEPPGPFALVPSGNAANSLCHRHFPPDLAAAENPAIWSFATPEGFVIRCRSRTIVSPCSSVAQR
jgi:hypothetical protein